MQACSSTLYKMAQCLHLNCILISTSFLIPKQGKFYVNSCKYNVNAMKIVDSTKQIQVSLFRIFWGKKLGGGGIFNQCLWLVESLDAEQVDSEGQLYLEVP